MAVPYKLLKTGGKLPHNKDLRAVLDVYETVGIKLLGDRIVKATSLTMGDLVGALEAIRYELVEQLMLGNRVHLPGLGYFWPAVKGELYEDPKTHRFRLRNPYVRTVNFRPEKALMQLLESTEFENRTYLEKAYDRPSAEDIEAALKRLFADADYIFIGDLQSELGLSKSAAYRLARRLEAEGRLYNAGSTYRKMYRKGETK